MKDREKLIELINEANCKWHNEFASGGIVEFIADYLISKGVMIRVQCRECKHLMFSDCYGECSRGHKGIVRPNDSCSYGERKEE